VFFAEHTFWPNGLNGVMDWLSVLIAFAALIAFVKFKRGAMETILVCALLGLAVKLLLRL